MIKNILAKIGSKKVAGAILVVATLLVGVGVISNFSDGSQKAANDAALSRFNDNAFNNFSGDSINRAALERQMSAQQNVNTARFIQGKSNQDSVYENDAFSSDGAYAEGVRGDEGFVYGDGSVYDPSNPMYVASAYDENGNPIAGAYGANGAAYGGADGSSDEAGANGANKGNKNNLKNRNKNRNASQTQLNKLAGSSSARSSYGGASGGGSMSGGGANFSAAMNGRDSATRALPQNNVQIEDSASAKAFRNGRAGAMGGFNVARAGGAVENAGKGDRGGAGADLQVAMAYSGKAIASDVEARAKLLAQAAFDGSNPEDIGATIESGSTIQQVANDLMGVNGDSSLPPALSSALQDLKKELGELERQQEELKKLKEKLKDRYIKLLAGTLAFFVAIAILVACNNIYTTIAAGVATAAAALFIAMQLWGGDYGIFDIIRKMGSDDLSMVNQGIDIGSKKVIAGAAGVLCGVIIGLAWTKAVTKVVKSIGKFFKTIGQRVGQTFKNLTGGVDDILKAIRGMAGK